MTDNENKPMEALEKELETLRAKIAHIQSFVQQREKESLLKTKKESAAGEASDRSFHFLKDGPLGMILVDHRYRIIKCNRSFLNQLGYIPQDIRSLNVPAITKNNKTCLQLINQIFDKAQKFSKTEARIFRKNGESFWSQFTVSTPADGPPGKQYCLVIIEDIIDSGLTMKYLIKLLEQQSPASIKVCSLLKKNNPEVKVQLDYYGFIIPNDAFVVGYGLDYAEKYRQLDHIATMK